jgi:hypothetical protein
MRLTVGPLPAAVYWRRRAVVLVGLAMVTLVISYACGGPDTVAGAQGSPSPSPTSLASSAPLLHPFVPTTPAATAFTLPTTAVTGPCADDEIALVAKAGATEVAPLTPLDVTIQIKNIGSRTCIRDIGADMQELRLVDATSTVMWSSDDCNPNRGHDQHNFAPGKQVSYTLTWSGRRSRTGTGDHTCGPSAPAPASAVYQLVARLDQKVSAPFTVRITSSA